MVKKPPAVQEYNELPNSPNFLVPGQPHKSVDQVRKERNKKNSPPPKKAKGAGGMGFAQMLGQAGLDGGFLGHLGQALGSFKDKIPGVQKVFDMTDAAWSKAKAKAGVKD